MSEEASIIISAVDKTEGALKTIQGNVGALEGQFGRLSNVVSGFAALAGVTAFAGVIKGAVDSAAGLHDMAQQTGATVESLSAMKGAAKIAGVEMEQVAGGLGKLSKNMLDASNGTGDALKVFNALGISVTDTSGRLKSSDAVMMEFSKALQTVGSSTERAAAAQLVFGKSGAALMPMLNDLSELSNLQAKVTTSQAAAADQLGDTMTKLEAVHKSWVTTVAMEVVPAANAFAEALLESATSANGLKTTSQELAADGSIKAWAIGAAQAGGYVIDVFDGAARSIKAIGLTIGAAAAQSSMIAQGNFGGAMAIGKEWLTDLDKLASKEQFSDILARKIADIGSESTKAAVGTKSLAGALATAGEAAATADKSLANLMDKLFGKDVGLDATYWKDLDTLFKGYKRGALDAESYATAVGKLTSSQKFNTAANDAAAKVQEDYVKNVEALINPLEQQAYQLERQVEFYGMTESAIQATLVARLEESRQMAAGQAGFETLVETLNREIEARKRIGAASSQKDFLDANKKAAEESAKEWEKFSDDINRALTDALMRGFEDGKSFGQNFVDSLKNSLKTAALKIVVNVATSTGGSLVNSAINAVVGTSDSNGGAGTNYLGLASNANSAYNLYNGSYIDTIGNAASYGSTTLGYTYGTNAFSQQSSMLAAQDAGLAGSGMGSSAWATMLEGGWVALIPIIGKALFGSTERYLDTSIQGTLGSGGFSGQFGDTYKTTGNIFGAVGRQTDWYPVTGSSADIAGSTAFTNKSVVQGLMAPSEYGGYSTEVQTMLDESLSSQLASITEQSTAFKKAFEGIYDFSKTSLQNIAGIFEDSTLADKIKDYAVNVDLQFSGSVDKVFADFGEKVMVGMGGAWLPSVEALRASGETWSQALGRLVNESAAMGQILLAMGTSIKDAFGANETDAILKSSDALVKLFGSVEKLGESFGAYYQNFYTQEELNKKAMESLTAQFTNIGLVIPSTRAEFRKMVDSLDLTSNSGQTTFKSLMDLQGSFAQLVPAAAEAAKTVDDTATALAKLKQDLQNSSAALQVKADAIITTYGDVVSAMAEINPAAATLVDSWRDNKTAMQSLQSTFDQFFGVTVPDAAATIQSLLTQLSAFEGGIATARGNADNARVQGMTPAERVTFWRTQEATLWQGLGNSTDKAGTISKIMEAYGNTRSAELDALTADQTKLNATTKTGLQTQLEAWQTTLSVIEKAKSFAKDLDQFMGSLAFSDLSALNYNDQLAAAGTLYSTTLAGAQSGDVNAMGNYTGNAQSYLEEARAMFGSGLEYANIYAKVTGDASGLGLSLNQDGTQAQSEIDRLTSAISGLTTTIPAAFAQETSDGYIRIEGALTAGADYSRTQMDEQKALLQKQIAQQQEIIANQQAQIEQQAALHAELMAQQAAQTARLTALESNASLAGAGA